MYLLDKAQGIRSLVNFQHPYLYVSECVFLRANAMSGSTHLIPHDKATVGDGGCWLPWQLGGHGNGGVTGGLGPAGCSTQINCDSGTLRRGE